jgi:hypothetical protein
LCYVALEVLTVVSWLRDAQKKVAKEVLRYKLKKAGMPVPSDADLDRHSERLLEEAEKVLKEQGGKLAHQTWDGLKEGAKEMVKAAKEHAKGKKPTE